MARQTPGIRARHSRSCRTTAGGSCNCAPAYEVWVWSPHDGVKIRKTFAGTGALAAAKSWRADALSALGRGKLRPPTRRTLQDEAAEWQTRAEAGEAVTRSGRSFKPAVVRGVESDFRLHISPSLGPRRLSEIRRHDVQALVDRLRTSGLSGSKVRGVVTSLKIVLRRPLEDDELTVNPTERLRLPPPAGTRDRAATVDEVERLIAALPVDLRPLYATAAYCGLRRGELRGLHWEDVNLATGVVSVVRAWDDRAGPIPPKSDAGTREVPIPPLLRDYLAGWKARTGRDGAAFVFGNVPGRPFTPTNVWRRAKKAWDAANKAEIKLAANEEREPQLLVPAGLHELRHVWVSLLHDADFSLEQIAAFAGHGSAWMTERYKHLLPGAAATAGDRFGVYLERANTLRRLEQIGSEDDPTGAQTGAHEPDTAPLSQSR
jgi:integrase